MAFHEKPDRTLAVSLLASWAMWNTLILIAKADFLWNLGRRQLQQMVGLFQTLAAVIGGSDEESILQSVYAQLPSLNFCSDLLSHCTADLAVIEMDGVLWSDWGRPERIFETLLQIGEKPALGWNCAACQCGVDTETDSKAKEQCFRNSPDGRETP